MYLVINNFYGNGPEAMMDDMDRACSWHQEKVSDASDNDLVTDLKDEVADLKEDREFLRVKVRQLEMQNAALKLDLEKKPTNAFVEYASTAARFTQAAKAIDEAIESLLRAGLKIQAIKVYRNFSGLGLKESKDYVDSLNVKPQPSKGRKCWDCEHRDAFMSNEPCASCDYANGYKNFKEITSRMFHPSCGNCEFTDRTPDEQPCEDCSWLYMKEED